ncbi:MAG: DoxX family protein [Rudaea sp.]|nr:DoxX family protein [Rudaea sp.]
MREFIAARCQTILDVLQRFGWLAPLVVRLFFGYFWLETGWAKIHNLDGFTDRFVDWGIPFPAFSAAASAWVEFLGGGFIMLGFLTRLTSVAMIVNMIVAIALVVIKKVGGFDDFIELDEFVYILIFFWLLMAGPGAASIDSAINRWLGISTQRY